MHKVIDGIRNQSQRQLLLKDREGEDVSKCDNADLVKEAWFDFVEKSIIRKDVVRPEILKSWQRSRNINPYDKKKKQLSVKELEAKKSINSELLSIARPIMQELSVMVENSIVCLTDYEGIVLDVVGNDELLPLGTCCSEADAGTNCISMVLEEETPFEISGYEHYRKCSHMLHSVGVPIKNNADLLGVLCFISPWRKLPQEMFQTVKLAVRSIEIELSKHWTLFSLINCVQYGLFIVDGNGKILNINTKSQEILGISNRNDIINQHLSKFVINSQQLCKVLEEDQPKQYAFKIKTDRDIVHCILRFKNRLISSDELEQNFILFTFEVKLKETANISLKPRQTHGFPYFEELVGGRSLAWQQVKELAIKACRVNSNILIVGESGTGKEMLARAIHNGRNLSGPFVPINCGAIPKELLQSELFGYEEGAFSGARKGGAIGKFELANRGTILLDEIGEMPMDMQVSLLRFLQDKTVVRVGGTKFKKIDVGVISATNRDLEEAIENGTFREDLFYRLNVINIKLPPLRQRKEDIPLFINHMLKKFSHQLNQEIPVITDDAYEILINYDWPGNIRELGNVIEHAVVFAEGGVITPKCLPARLLEREKLGDSEDLRINELKVINKVLQEYNGNISQTARALGITRSTLYRKIEKLKSYSL